MKYKALTLIGPMHDGPYVHPGEDIEISDEIAAQVLLDGGWIAKTMPPSPPPIRVEPITPEVVPPQPDPEEKPAKKKKE